MQTPERRRPLGRGLSSLISEARAPIEAARAGVSKLPIQQIRPNPKQPRRHFDDAALNELAQSIHVQGVLQPVLVQKDGRGGYRLIAGERRWRAAQKAGLSEIPALVHDGNEGESFELALVENLQREDLSPLEAAEGYRKLMEERRWTQEQVADRVGKQRATVANALRLLNLPAEVKGLLAQGQIEMGHARALLGMEKASDLVSLARAVVAEKLSVRETETRVRQTRPPEAQKKKAHKASPEARKLVEDLQRRLGTRVSLVDRGSGKGVLHIEFFTYEDLERIVSKIQK